MVSVREKITTIGSIEKMPTGIDGLDTCLSGGLPRERNTVLMGGPGSGKTVLALQILVNGAQKFNEPGIFVAFEENSRQIVNNAGTFGWDLAKLEKQKLFFLDAKMRPNTVQAGEFDLTGMLAVIENKAREMNARRIVFDSIDVLLSLLDNPATERQELFRLYDWLLHSGMTAIITAKSDTAGISLNPQYSNMQFMADCVIQLSHQLSRNTSIRNLWVMKYRGSSFMENQVPVTIGNHGMEITADITMTQTMPASNKRVSTGVKRLDTMLNGGFFRGTCILITGAPGTAKSTLAAAFVDATCKRRERALYISFDSSSSELARNFKSVNIHFDPHIQSGKLLVNSPLADACSAKEHYVRIRNLIEQHNPTCVVIDPLSAIIKGGGEELAQNISEHLILLCRSLGITLLNTSLLDTTENIDEATPIHISTIADAWIHLSYVIHAGERNRALSIIKARGTKHSNQVRELILSDEGVTITDPYTAAGEVLMGAMRMQKEHAEHEEENQRQTQMEMKRLEIEYAQAELGAKLDLLKHELEMKNSELKLLAKSEENRKHRLTEHITDIQKQRTAGKNNKPRGRAKSARSLTNKKQ